jgi:hypothetical protein
LLDGGFDAWFDDEPEPPLEVATFSSATTATMKVIRTASRVRPARRVRRRRRR